ncbi:DUF1206 domain-containing protein [Agromyces sp. SYSU T00194]|uniref:DUF1206 domain-containing protein n=1 Tax=Agromyces chitinivorans TaxID=3158560 RepID=UPI00339A61BF
MDIDSPKDAARTAERSRTFQVFARSGYVVLGVIHAIIGAIAISVASGGGGGEADQSGAMQQIAKTPFGGVLLWAIAIGLFALAIWSVAEALLARGSDAKEKWGERLKEGGKAVTYVAIGWTALVFAMGGSSDSDQSSQGVAAMLIQAPGGVFVLGLIGLVVLGIGGAFVWRGVRLDFTESIDVPSGPVGSALVALGVAGYVAKGIGVGIVGVLFVIAAFTLDPEQAGGLDAALKSLLGLPFGVVLLWAIGLGLIAYGAYSVARAKYARL